MWKEEEDESFWEKIKDEIDWIGWRTKDIFQNWFFPAYKVKNLLWKRYDLVRLPLKKTEYCDVLERMFQANMSLIVEFMEKEKPEDHVIWYGEEGHKYSECEKVKILFPEYKNMYIMDLIKKIYKFYKEDLPRMENEYSYLLSVWYDHLHCAHWQEDKNDSELLEIVEDPMPLTAELLKEKDKEFNWDIILKYVAKKEDILIPNLLWNKTNELEWQIEEKKQHFLHLCIEVRNYLWT